MRSTDTPVIDPADLAVRGIQLGRYTLLRRLAVGGMAELFLAEARGVEGFAKVVALKRILPQFAANAQFTKMFLHEARLVARLDHPNIAQVYDIGQTGESYFFTMEYVHGEDLRRLLNHAYRVGRGLPLEHAVAIGIGIAAGLHHAHEQVDDDGRLRRIVHRDVTPSNVRVSYNGHVKILDFGVAKAETSGIITNRDQVKGSISYMSPEQCRGDDIDRRSDVFAMGILLYEATTSSRLFKGEDEAAVMRQIELCRIAPPSTRRADYPPELERIVMKALQRDRERRHDNAQELQLELEAFARHEGLVISTVSLASYMERLFGAKISAWQQAQKRGQSFGAHLAGTVEIRMDEVAFLDDKDVIEEKTVASGTSPDTPRVSPEVTTATTPSSKVQSGYFKRHRALVAIVGVGVVIGVGLGFARALRSTDEVAAGTPPPVEKQPEAPIAKPPEVKSEPLPKEDLKAIVDEAKLATEPTPVTEPAKEAPRPRAKSRPTATMKKPPEVGSAKPDKPDCPAGTERLATGKCVSKVTKPW